MAITTRVVSSRPTYWKGRYGVLLPGTLSHSWTRRHGESESSPKNNPGTSTSCTCLPTLPSRMCMYFAPSRQLDKTIVRRVSPQLLRTAFLNLDTLWHWICRLWTVVAVESAPGLSGHGTPPLSWTSLAQCVETNTAPSAHYLLQVTVESARTYRAYVVYKGLSLNCCTSQMPAATTCWTDARVPVIFADTLARQIPGLQATYQRERRAPPGCRNADADAVARDGTDLDCCTESQELGLGKQLRSTQSATPAPSNAVCSIGSIDSSG